MIASFLFFLNSRILGGSNKCKSMLFMSFGLGNKMTNMTIQNNDSHQADVRASQHVKVWTDHFQRRQLQHGGKGETNRSFSSPEKIVKGENLLKKWTPGSLLKKISWMPFYPQAVGIPNFAHLASFFWAGYPQSWNRQGTDIHQGSCCCCCCCRCCCCANYY